MRQKIVLNDQWFECVEAIASIQRTKDELEYAVQKCKSKQELENHVLEIIDVDLVEALARSCKALIRASGAEAWPGWDKKTRKPK